MHDTIFTVREGERIEVIMQNQTGWRIPCICMGIISKWRDQQRAYRRGVARYRAGSAFNVRHHQICR
jgi:hypothetical protein